ncbi:hypothetical protein M758_3G171200 [Ceratodon purpureus]|nr:hypothetical protein M758_3G171200 [Ceratodon purpureus]
MSSFALKAMLNSIFLLQFCGHLDACYDKPSIDDFYCCWTYLFTAYEWNQCRSAII